VIRGLFKLCWAMLLLSLLVVYWMVLVTFWIGREIFHRVNSLRKPKHTAFVGHPGFETSPPKPDRIITRIDRVKAQLADVRINAV
jgi:hypothetical protein